MARVHRALFDRLGDRSVPAVILDTPYGFQENADELSARSVEFFAGSVGRPAVVASLPSRDVDPLTMATAVALISRARYVMAGPGSPSYALRQWAGGPVPGALADLLATGGIVTVASAAALTIGIATVPVYEIYKVGEPPHWLEGLDLLGRATGLRAAVIPHYDNAEGGTHDTRFCYLGERRLAVLERDLPAGAFVLGVDGHTALLLDLEGGTASIAGLGGVTVRVAGRSRSLPAGSTFPIEELGETARSLAAAGAPETAPGAGTPGEPAPRETTRLEAAVVGALEAGDARAGAAALLELDEAIAARIRHGEDSPELDGAWGIYRSLVARLGDEVARQAEPRALVGPFVEALLEVRARARAAADWTTADLVRDRLAAAGVEVRDEPAGTAWTLR